MKNKLMFISSLAVCCFALVACGSQDKPSDGGSFGGDGQTELSNFEKALSSVSNYNIRTTNGFDYSIKQFYSSEIVNSKLIQLRVKFDDGTQAKKIENTKSLNTYGQGEQFTTTEKTTYFRNNQICENDGSGWTWRAYDESEYLKTGLSSLSLDEDYFSNITETKEGADIRFSADIPANYVKTVLGNDANGFTQVKASLLVKNDYSLMKSLTFTYNQEKTNSEVSFVSVFDSGTIDFPQ